MQMNDVGSADFFHKRPDELIAGNSDRPNEQIVKAEEQHNSANEEYDDGDDSDPPKCERQQFTQYVMSSISDMSERSAVLAMKTIKLFLQKWPGYTADK